jgi:MoxR-like ATPase
MTTNHEAAAALERVLFEIKRVIVGQDHLVERLLVALLARGHVLLEGVPGLAKTLAVSTLAEAIGGSFVRLQFTPDLLPSDLIGTRIWRASTEEFDIEWGPVFANLVLADEVNRAPAKVQSALLEVMAEHQVSIGGTTRSLPSPFLVLATQNPVESEGVYSLPEAQRDRFLMKVVVSYPSPEEELEIIRRMGVKAPEASQVLSLGELESLQALTDKVYVDAAVAQYAVDLVMATREPAQRNLPELEPLIELGVSPRASLGLVAASRALALLRGRDYVVPQDTFDVARDVLRHRLMLSYEALAKGVSAESILHRVLAVVPAAAISPVELEHRSAAPTTPLAASPDPGAGPSETSVLPGDDSSAPHQPGALAGDPAPEHQVPGAPQLGGPGPDGWRQATPPAQEPVVAHLPPPPAEGGGPPGTTSTGTDGHVGADDGQAGTQHGQGDRAR